MSHQCFFSFFGFPGSENVKCVYLLVLSNFKGVFKGHHNLAI